jgi:DNA modification methylase
MADPSGAVGGDQVATDTAGNVAAVKAQLVIGDARNPLGSGIAAGSVDCIVTSPPYWNLKRYGDEVAGEVGHGQTLEAYLADMETVFQRCFEVARETAAMWVIADTLRYPTRTEREFEMLPLPTTLAELAQAVGWRFHDLVIWRKNKTLPYSGDRKLRNLVEYILLLTKDRQFKHRPHRLAERHQPHAEWLAGWPERYHPLGRNPSNIWDIEIPTQGIWAHADHLHFCPLPADLVRRCIDLTSDPGDTVFDPFGGIGTVPAQAEAMGRVGIGTELNARFVEIFETKTRPEFLAAWEEGARTRQLAREDQASEAALILKLRALKAGKELMRLLERTAQASPAGHASSDAETVIVRLGADPASCIDVLEGRSDSLPAELLVVGELSREARKMLSELVSDALESSAFKTFSLNLEFELIPPSAVDAELALSWPEDRDPELLFEFDLGRHGAFTQRPTLGLFPSLPRLLTTFEIGAPLHPTTLSPLEQARTEGEKKLLQTLVTSGLPLETIAEQLRLPQVELDQLLQKHGLSANSLAFAVALPDELLERAEDLEA